MMGRNFIHEKTTKGNNKKKKQDLNQHINSGLVKQIEKEIQSDYWNYTSRQLSDERKIELLKEAKRNF